MDLTREEKISLTVGSVVVFVLYLAGVLKGMGLV